MADLLTPEDFEPHTGSEFRVMEREPAVALRLDRLTRFQRQAHVREPFSLFFVGPASEVMSQGTYKLEHQMGTLELFLVPIKADETGVTYEAAFA